MIPVPALPSSLARPSTALTGTSRPNHVWSLPVLALDSSSLLHLDMHERQRQAEQHNRAARLVAARKWERRAAAAARRARLARAAVR